jgi:hypothetical protein
MISLQRKSCTNDLRIKLSMERKRSEKFFWLTKIFFIIWRHCQYNTFDKVLNEGCKMRIWFMLTGNEPEKLNETFMEFFSSQNLPQGVALWKWKRSCWICSPEKYRQEILTAFVRFGIIEFASAPSSADIEFMRGDATSLPFSS